MVDSDPGSVQILHSSLGSKDYRIVRASNANEALERIKSRRVDLLVISLPSADALELCKRVRSQPSCARLPIVLFLGEAHDRQEELHARQAGAEEVCSRSIDPRDLAARLQNLLRLAEVNRDERLFHQLAQSDRLVTLGQLAATVAHEINNPLAFILSNLNNLQGYLDDVKKVLGAYHRSHSEGAALEDELQFGHAISDAESIVGETIEGGKQVRTLVQELKNLSRVDGGVLEPVDLAEIAASTLLLTERELSSRARIVKALSPAPVSRANRGKLHQVVLNLLVNAAQAMDGNEPEHNELRIVTETDGKDALLSVSDTGCGIAPEEQERIFDLFYTTKPAGVGTGIGLSVCAMVVQRLGGRIVVRSAAGQGSTFTVRLPFEASLN
jgi:signal transduction histidine kinase